MAYTATLSLYLSVTGNGVNEQSAPIASWQNTNSPAIRGYQRVLSGGDNTITPPLTPVPTAQVVIIVVPSGFTIKWKGAAGDTGYTLGTSESVLIVPVGSINGPDGNPGSFILNANGQCVATMWWL